MGGTLTAQAPVDLRVHLKACPHFTIKLLLDGHETPALPPRAAASGNETLTYRWIPDAHPHWIRAEVRDANGSLVLISNPIYINPAIQ